MELVPPVMDVAKHSNAGFTALHPPDISDAGGPSSSSVEECPVCMEPIGANCEKAAKAWPAECSHSFCEGCWEGCISRSLKCPMCRAEAPESARPIDKEKVMLTAMQMIRLNELERLRREEEERRARRQPKTRIGKWIHRRIKAVNRALDDILGFDE